MISTTTVKKIFKSKYVKLGFKILGVIVALWMVLLTALSFYISRNKQRIIATIKDKIETTVRGDISIGNIDVSVWKYFPHIGFEVNDISLKDSLYHQPLAEAKLVQCRLNVFEFLTSDPVISRVTVSDGLFHLFVDSNGYNNSYLLAGKKKDSTTVKKSGKPIIIKNIALVNMRFISEHAIKQKRYALDIEKANASIKREDSLLLIDLNVNCFIHQLGFNLAKGSYLDSTTVNANWKIKVDTKNKEVKVEPSAAVINNNDFIISALFHLKDSLWFSIHAKADELLYKDGQKLLTARIQRKVGFIDVTKPLKIEATISGPLAYRQDPYVYVVCTATDNELQTPITTFTGSNFIGIYTNRVNNALLSSDENSVIYFRSFNGKWGDINLTADSIRVSNLAKPTLHCKFHAQCTFPQLDDNLSLESVGLDDGTAELNILYNGPLTANPAMLGKVSGSIKIANGTVEYLPRNLAFTNCNGLIYFAENNLQVQQLTCDYKSNHFEINANGNQFGRLAMSDSGKITMVCNIKSPSVNLNDFKDAFANRRMGAVRHKKKKFGVTVSNIDNLLQKGDLIFNLNIDEVQLDHFKGQNLAAAVSFYENDWHINKAYIQFAGGSLNINANASQSQSSMLTHAVLDMKDVDVSKTFYAFDDFGQDDITHANIQGRLTTHTDINLQLNNKGAIIPGSMNGKVDFSIKNGSLVNFPPVMNIGKYAFKNRNLNDVRFAEIKNNLTIQNHIVTIPRMEVASSVIRMFVEGTYGFKAPTDILIQVPLSTLKSHEDSVRLQKKGVDAKVGPSIYLHAKTNKDGKIKIGLDLFGSKKKKKKAEKDKAVEN
jgi:hypothetical protein